MPKLASSFALVEFEQVEPAPSIVLLRLAATGGDELRDEPSTLLVDGLRGQRRHAPLPAPPSDQALIRMAFSMPVAEMRGATFSLQLPDGSVVHLPAPTRRLKGPRPIGGSGTAKRAVRSRNGRDGGRRRSDALAEAALVQQSVTSAAEITLLRAAATQLRSDLDGARRTAETAEARSRELEAELDGRRSDRSELEALRASAEEREAESRALRARVDELEADRADAAHADRPPEADAAVETVAGGGEVEHLQEQLEMREHRVDELDRYAKEMEHYSDDLESHLDETLSRATQAELAVADQRAEITLLREMLIEGQRPPDDAE